MRSYLERRIFYGNVWLIEKGRTSRKARYLNKQVERWYFPSFPSRIMSDWKCEFIKSDKSPMRDPGGKSIFQWSGIMNVVMTLSAGRSFMLLSGIVQWWLQNWRRSDKHKPRLPSCPQTPLSCYNHIWAGHQWRHSWRWVSNKRSSEI